MKNNDKSRPHQGKPVLRYTGYFAVLMILIALTDVLDNMGTNIGGNITSSFITEFFVNGTVFGRSYTYESGLALHNTIGLLGYVIALMAPFYKALADKIGRKPLFAISSLGMSLGLLIIFLSGSYLMFLAGSFLLSFFTGSDIQILYVLEEAPKEKRATIYSFLKGLGGLSSVAIPMMRATLMDNDPAKWRNVYLAPALFGFVVVILILLLAKETKAFADGRVRTRKDGKPAKSGIISAIGYIFHRKDLRTLLLIKMLFDAAMIAMTSYESIMHRADMSTADITTAEYFYPLLYCGSVILSGILADRIGRKKTVLIFGTACAISFALFILGANLLWNPAFVGIAYGLYLGGFWIGRDYMEIISTEMVPTDIRASVIGAQGLLVYIGMGLGFAFVNVGILFFPIWAVCLVCALPCILVSIILLNSKVEETMGVDYEAIPEDDGP